MNLQEIRRDFPILSKGIIYLDSAATSLTPQPVLDAILEYYRELGSNVGRGIYSLAQQATQRYEWAHEAVAKLIRASPDQIVFTRNTTESINAVAWGLDWKKGDKILSSILDHHSNLLPWMRISRRFGVELELIGMDSEGRLDISQLESKLDDSTKLVAIPHASNVLGSLQDLRSISKICQEHGCLLLVDGAQSVPHLPMDVRDIGYGFLCFSGHKMLGPKGTGVLWICREMLDELEPVNLGGGTVEDVWMLGYKLKDSYQRFEGGTPDIPGGIGLGVAAEYLRRIGMDRIRSHEIELTRELLRGLEQIPQLEVYGPRDLDRRVGVVSFNIRGMNPHDVATMLDEIAKIMVRSGYHCCIPLMRKLGLDQGTVRASVYIYNTHQEIQRLLEVVEELAREFGERS